MHVSSQHSRRLNNINNVNINLVLRHRQEYVWGFNGIMTYMYDACVAGERYSAT